MYARKIKTNPKIVNLATNLPRHPKKSFPKITKMIKTQAINENKVLWSKIKILLPNSKLTKTPEIKVPDKSKTSSKITSVKLTNPSTFQDMQNQRLSPIM